ncbi:MAG: cadherin domain-containing protein [Pseudomonadota bacterium]
MDDRKGDGADLEETLTEPMSAEPQSGAEIFLAARRRAGAGEEDLAIAGFGAVYSIGLAAPVAATTPAAAAARSALHDGALEAPSALGAAAEKASASDAETPPREPARDAADESLSASAAFSQGSIRAAEEISAIEELGPLAEALFFDEAARRGALEPAADAPEDAAADGAPKASTTPGALPSETGEETTGETARAPRDGAIGVIGVIGARSEAGAAIAETTGPITAERAALAAAPSAAAPAPSLELDTKATAINDEAPIFAAAPLIAAREDIAPGAPLHRIAARDPDGAQEPLSYSLSENADGLFQIDPNTGVVSLAPGRALDFETAPAHQIAVRVSDGIHSARQSLDIAVLDVQENQAPTALGATGGVIAETAAPGAVVATLAASDPDPSDAHRFEILSDPSGLFIASGDQLQLAPGATLDFETAQSHTLSLRAIDDAGAFVDGAITVTVTDANDISPVFTSGGAASISEATDDSAVIYRAAATDADATGEPITYRLINDAGGLFEIEANTGAVSLAAGRSLDFETATSHSITIESSDGLNTAAQIVAIAVTNENDSGQIFISAAAAAASESASDSAVILTAAATDLDGAGALISYSLTNDAGGLFEIDATTGAVSLATGRSLDFETATSHSITIESSDGLNTGTQTVSIAVQDEAEALTVAGAFTDAGVAESAITGGAGADAIVGADAGATLFGLGGDDALTGGAGDDALTGAAGDDTLSGGGGDDVARYAGASSDFRVEDLGGGAFRITDLTGAEGVDTLTNIEFLSFNGAPGAAIAGFVNTAPSAPTAKLTAGGVHQESGGLVVIEAPNYASLRDGDDNAWAAGPSAGFMGTAFDAGSFWSSPGGLSAAPAISYQVAITTTGTYYFHLRGAGDGSGNSVHLGVGGAPVTDGQGISWAPSGPSWADDPTAVVAISTPGTYEITIWGREDGASFDKLIMTTDAAYAPSGAGPSESATLGAVIDESAGAGAALADLSAVDAQGHAITYQITDASGTAIADSRVALSGSALQVGAGGFSFEDGASQTVYVAASDGALSSAPTALTFTVRDAAETVTLADGGAVFVDEGVAETLILGGTGDDAITAHLAGSAMSGGAGNDTLTGDIGVDEARYAGPASNYLVEDLGGGAHRVTDLTGAEGVDTLTDFELLSFNGAPGAAIAGFVNSAPSSPTATYPASFQESGGLVVLDANSHTGIGAGATHNWIASAQGVTTDVNNGSSWHAPADIAANAPMLSYRVNFSTPGTYYVHVRGEGSGTNNSVHVGLNGVVATDTGGIGWSSGATLEWGDDDTAVLTVASAGVHEVNLWAREDGSEVATILLTQDPNYAPAGAGPAESASASVGSVTEGAAQGAKIADLASVDAEGDAITYVITDSAGTVISDNRVQIVGAELQVGATGFDFEAGASATVYVAATDGTLTSAPTTLTLSVVDAAEALTLGNGGGVFTDAGVSETSVTGGAGDDVLTALPTYASLSGGAGDDQLTANGVSTTLSGGAGDDVISASGVRILEAGTETFTQGAAGNWFSVAFDGPIANAVVVLSHNSANGDLFTYRVRNVDENGFEFQLDEWDYLDGTHAQAETVSWLAVSAGVHTLDDGVIIEAGAASVDHDFETINFAASFGAAPVVLAQAASVNDAEAVTDRIQSVNASSFQVKLENQESAPDDHPSETVGWIAIDDSAAVGASISATTATNVDESVGTAAFAHSFSAPPVALADMQTYNGKDTAVGTITAVTTTNASVRAAEEQSNDGEILHAGETFGLIALPSGVVGGGYQGSLAYQGDLTDFAVSYDGATETFTITDHDHGDGLDEGRDTVTGVESFTFNGASVDMAAMLARAAALVSGTGGDDPMNGGAGADILSGGAGADVFAGGAGADLMIGARRRGDVEFIIARAADVIDGGAGGADLIRINGLDDTIVSQNATTLQTNGWTLSVTSGAIASVGASSAALSADAAGRITLTASGDEIAFSNLESVVWL